MPQSQITDQPHGTMRKRDRTQIPTRHQENAFKVKQPALSLSLLSVLRDVHRGGSRISGKGVHIYKGSGRVLFAVFTSKYIIYSINMCLKIHQNEKN